MDSTENTVSANSSEQQGPPPTLPVPKRYERSTTEEYEAGDTPSELPSLDGMAGSNRERQSSHDAILARRNARRAQRQRQYSSGQLSHQFIAGSSMTAGGVTPMLGASMSGEAGNGAAGEHLMGPILRRKKVLSMPLGAGGALVRTIGIWVFGCYFFCGLGRNISSLLLLRLQATFS